MAVTPGVPVTPRGHPRGLYVLFFSEMWERFSFYGMRALLVLYLVNALEFPRSEALQIYATYTGLIYFTPLIGGYIADRWLGAGRAVLAGGILMALGHFAMAFPPLLYFAMGLLIAGNGFFKPNISVLVGSLYTEGDTRRDSGFTIFYMGINLGAFLAPLVCGTLGQKIGWHYGFAAAGVGMVAGIIVFLVGGHRFGGVFRGSAYGTVRDWSLVGVTVLAGLGLVLVVVGAWPRLAPWWQDLGVIGRTASALGVIATAYLLTRKGDGEPPLSRAELHRVFAILVILVFVVFFWMGFEQAGGTMNLFADQRIERGVLGWEVPASFFQAVNPLLILLLGPFFSLLWVRLDRSPGAISVVGKQGLGMIILGLGFVVLAIADERAAVIGKVSAWWLVAVYFFHTAGELCLSPIGLSMVTKLAPARFVSLMMGAWFTAMALANYLAGTMENLLAGTGIPLYWFLVASSIGAGVVLLLIAPLLGRLMHGIR